PRTEPGLVAKQLGHVADSPARRQIADPLAEEPCLARGWLDQAEEQLDRGRLARAVGTEKAEDLAPGHGHGEAGQRDGAAEPFGQVDGVNGRCGGGRPWGSGRRGNRRWLSHEARLPESAHLRPLAIVRTSDCLRKPATAKTLPFLIQITPAPAPVLSPSATPWTPCTVTLLEVAYWIGTGIKSVVEGSPIARSEAASCGEMPGMDRM